MGIPSRRPQFEALTSVRFFAAFHVLVYHVQGYVLPALDHFPGLRNIIQAGPNSVALFFVLSGFILSYTYLGPPEEGRLQRGSFWAARFARVYPVYFFGLMAAAPIWILGFLQRGATVPRFVLVAATVPTLVQAWTPTLALAWNSPSWSLSVEAFFYLVFPFVAPSLWTLRFRGLLLCLALFWCLSQLGPALYTWIDWPPSMDSWVAAADDLPYLRLTNPGYMALQYNPLARLPEFLFGVALGRLYLLQPTSARPRLWTLVACAAIVAVLAALAWAPAAVRSSLFFHNGLLTPLYGLLIYALARDPRGLLGRALSLRALVLLGEASYALYLLHVPVRNALAVVVERLGIGSLPTLPLVAGYSLGCVLMSIAVLRWIEEPARRFLRRRLAPRE